MIIKIYKFENENYYEFPYDDFLVDYKYGDGLRLTKEPLLLPLIILHKDQVEFIGYENITNILIDHKIYWEYRNNKIKESNL